MLKTRLFSLLPLYGGKRLSLAASYGDCYIAGVCLDFAYTARGGVGNVYLTCGCVGAEYLLRKKIANDVARDCLNFERFGVAISKRCVACGSGGGKLTRYKNALHIELARRTVAREACTAYVSKIRVARADA